MKWIDVTPMLALIASATTAVLGAGPAAAFSEATHRIINEQAARQSSLDRVLKSQLGIEQGLDQPFLRTRAMEPSG
jgi:hypothetical protein